MRTADPAHAYRVAEAVVREWEADPHGHSPRSNIIVLARRVLELEIELADLEGDFALARIERDEAREEARKAKA